MLLLFKFKNFQFFYESEKINVGKVCDPKDVNFKCCTIRQSLLEVEEAIKIEYFIILFMGNSIELNKIAHQ